MHYFKKLFVISLLTFSANATNNVTLYINEDKVLQAIEILTHVEEATFQHQEDCRIKETNICTCNGDYLALIAYNRIVQAKQLLCDAVEVKLESEGGE